PPAHARPHDAVGLLEPGFALQKRLGFVIEIEARRLPVAGHLVAAGRQKPARRLLRILAAHPEINGSLGKGAVEVANGKPRGPGEQCQANHDETVIRTDKPLSHKRWDYRFSAQCSPIPPRT